MNGKQAKRLRRVALGLATTFDEAGRKIHPNGYVVEKHEQPSQVTFKANGELTDTGLTSASGEPILLHSSTFHNRPDSLRQIYRSIKKGVAAGKA